VTGAITIRHLLGCLAMAAIVLGLLELSFRIYPPAAEQPYYFFDEQESIMKFDTGRKRDGLYTFGSLAEIRGRWHVNANGWLNENDYASRPNKPVIAVIGDSYVEALQVDYRNTMSSQLSRKLGGSYEVYSFGLSGANLSQYLLMSRYVQRNFNPKIMIFNIIDGDIPGSLLAAGNKPGYLYFSIGSEGVKEVPLPYHASRLKSSFRKSALLRYLILNKGILDGPTSPPAQGVRTDLSGDDADKSRIIVDYAFSRIRQENPDCTVFLILDPPRKDLYRGESNAGYLASRKLLAESSSRYGFHLVDMLPVMSRLYQKNRQKFNFEINDHWNDYGHQVVAEQIYRVINQSRKVTAGDLP